MSGKSVDPDETPRSVPSHLGLRCLLRPVCPNACGKYGILLFFFFVFFFVVFFFQRKSISAFHVNRPPRVILSEKKKNNNIKTIECCLLKYIFCLAF